MRQISFFLTTNQFLHDEKDVTRRLGWDQDRAPAGTQLMAVNKCRGLKKGEQIKYGPILILSNTPEPLEDIVRRPVRNDQLITGWLADTETKREGFPQWRTDPEKFVKFFIKSNPRKPSGEKVTRKTPVNRIVFRRQTVIEVQNHG